MAKNTRPNLLKDSYKPSAVSRARKNIQAWRSALQAAENVTNPRRTLLYNLYDELVIDAHLTAEMQKRTLNIVGSEFYLYNGKGIHDEEVAKLISTPWFVKFLTYAMETRYYGHSLLQMEFGEDDLISDLPLMPRRHVRPENGLWVIQQNDDKGISFREDPKYNKWLIEIGGKDDLGLLNKAAPHVLYKRFAQSAWSEFCEIFGMPLRVTKTDTVDTGNLDRLNSMMIEMATAGYAIIDKEEEIEFIESAKTKGEVYSEMMAFCNNELSMLVSGSIIGGTGDGGSYAKEQVGMDVQQAITVADKQWIEGLVNTVLIPKLVAVGYPMADFRFEFERGKDIQGIWTITKGILEHYEVEDQFIKDTFGIPVTGKKQTPGIQATAKGELGFFD